MNRIFFVAILATLFFSACQDTNTTSTTVDTETKTASGFPYKFHIDEPGDTPREGERITFNVTRRFDDSIVYQSAQRGVPDVTMIPNAQQLGGRKKPPVFEMFEMMSVGDSASVYMNVDSLNSQLEPWQKEKDFLVFDIKMLKIENFKEKENAAATVTADLLAKYKDGSLKGIKTLSNGLKIHVVEEGKGEKPQAGDIVSAKYFGVLVSDGTMFDNSFKTGRDFSFPLGQGRVIKGWDTGFAELTPGTKAVLFIPGDLGYGAAGSPPKIPANAELAFYVEMVSVSNRNASNK